MDLYDKVCRAVMVENKLATSRKQQQRNAKSNISSEKKGATRNNKNNVFGARSMLRFARSSNSASQ